MKRAPKTEAAGALFELPLALIDEPELPVRMTMDPVQLEELADSIREVGLLQPIVVHQADGRYRIEAGHRRFIAAQRVGLKTIPALVRGAGGVSPEAVKIHENAWREDLNPAEEAAYYDTLLQRDCGGDVDKLCRLVRQRREYVEQRLLLVRGDVEVFTAVMQRRISLGVARELNKIPDQGYRRMYLDAAARGGATVRMVQEWRQQLAGITPAEPPPLTSGENQFTAQPAPVLTMKCYCCDQAERPWDLELVYICRSGCRQLLDRLLARAAGRE